MSSHHPESVQAEVRRYWKVFAALTIGTIITVAISLVHVPLVWVAIVAAAIVAIVKGSLVAAYFMHLLHERKLIYLVLVLTAGGVVIMVGLILWTRSDQQGVRHGLFQVPQRHVNPDMVHGESHGSGPASDHHELSPTGHHDEAPATEATHEAPAPATEPSGDVMGQKPTEPLATDAAGPAKTETETPPPAATPAPAASDESGK